MRFFYFCLSLLFLLGFSLVAPSFLPLYSQVLAPPFSSNKDFVIEDLKRKTRRVESGASAQGLGLDVDLLKKTFLAQLFDENEDLRDLALLGLLQEVGVSIQELKRIFFDGLLNYDEEICARSIWGLRAIGVEEQEIQDRLMAGLTDTSPLSRYLVVVGFQEMGLGRAQVQEALVGLLDDEVPGVGEKAQSLLTALEVSQADILETSDTFTQMGGGKKGDQLESWVEKLKNPEPEVYSEAVAQLVFFPFSFKEVEEALFDGYPTPEFDLLGHVDQIETIRKVPKRRRELFIKVEDPHPFTSLAAVRDVIRFMTEIDEMKSSLNGEMPLAKPVVKRALVLELLRLEWEKTIVLTRFLEWSHSSQELRKRVGKRFFDEMEMDEEAVTQFERSLVKRYSPQLNNPDMAERFAAIRGMRKIGISEGEIRLGLMKWVIRRNWDALRRRIDESQRLRRIVLFSI